MAALLHRNFIAGDFDEGPAGSRIPVLNPADLIRPPLGP